MSFIDLLLSILPLFMPCLLLMPREIFSSNQIVTSLVALGGFAPQPPEGLHPSTPAVEFENFFQIELLSFHLFSLCNGFHDA